MKFTFIFFVLMIVCSLSFAQDMHLTQYYTSNLSLNPAYTGKYDGDIRLTANYRSQWSQINSAFKTNMFSVEKKIHKYPDEIGVGLIFVNDYLSAYNLYTNKVIVSGSFQKNINNNLIRFGLQAGMAFRSIDINKQTYPDQWNYGAGIFDPNAPNRESALQNSKSYPMFSAGAGWTRKFDNKTVSAGYGLFNINRPKDGFAGNSTGVLPFRHTFNASLTWSFANQLSIIPHILYMRTASATDFIIGTNGKKMLNKDVGVLAGAGYRGSTLNSDAAMAVVGLSYKRIDFGFSMDFNVSELSKDSRSKTALEFSLIYTTPSRHASRVTIPCDRY